MRRLTTDDTDCMMSYLNTFYSDGGKVFIRGSGCAPDFQDVTLVDWIRSASSKQGLRFTADDPEHLYEEIHDVLDERYETVEGIIALLYRAAIQAAEMRRVLKSIEDILGGTYYDLDHLRELVQADREGRCMVLPCKPGDIVFQTNQADIFQVKIKKLIYDCGHIAFDDYAIGKSVFLTREAAEEALEGEK